MTIVSLPKQRIARGSLLNARVISPVIFFTRGYPLLLFGSESESHQRVGGSRSRSLGA